MNGIVIINKPKGCTSHDVVYKVKKIFNEKVGHTGTLDPNATGVLPILIGKGTRLSKYLINHDKTYEVVLKLGKKTDTADIEGKIIEERDVNKELLNKENVTTILACFKGKQEQMPPMYSAIKIDGKKLYEYARKGEKVELKSRKIEIYSIELISINKEQDEVIFKVECSKGTYIRSLCEDIAKKFDTIGFMKELKRTKVGEFDIQQSITIEQLEQNIDNMDFINQHFYTIESFFKENQSIILQEKELNKLLNGIKLKVELQDGLYRLYNKKKYFIGIGLIENYYLKRELILN